MLRSVCLPAVQCGAGSPRGGRQCPGRPAGRRVGGLVGWLVSWSVGARASRRQRAHTMSRRRRQERRRSRQPLAASRCAPRPSMARLGPARPGPAGGGAALTPGTGSGGNGSRGSALAWGAHAQRRGGAPAASEPFPRRCPRMKRRRVPADRGCASRRRRGAARARGWSRVLRVRQR